MGKGGRSNRDRTTGGLNDYSNYSLITVESEDQRGYVISLTSSSTITIHDEKQLKGNTMGNLGGGWGGDQETRCNRGTCIRRDTDMVGLIYDMEL